MSLTQEKRWFHQKSYKRHLARPKTYVVQFRTQKTSVPKFSYPNEAVFHGRRQEVANMIRRTVKREQQARFIRHLALIAALLAFTYFIFHFFQPAYEDSEASQTLLQSPLPHPNQETPKQVSEPELRALLQSEQPIHVKLKAIGLAGASAEVISFELLAQTARKDRALPVRLKAVRALSQMDHEEGLTPFFMSMIQGNDNVQIRLISLDWLLANQEVTQDHAKMDVIRNHLDPPLYARFVKQEVSL